MARFNPALPLITGPVIRHTVETTNLNGQHFQVVLDYMGQSPIGLDQATLIQFRINWRAACEAAFKDTLPASCPITKYIDADVSTGMSPTTPLDVNVPGNVITDPLTGTVAFILTKYTPRKGQHGRGRNYFGSVPDTFITPATDPNVINPAGAAIIAPLRTALLVPIAAGGINFNLCVTTRPEPPATLITRAAIVVILNLQPVLGTVRRRRTGRGM